MKQLIVYGAGGHAKSVLDSLDRSLYEVVGFIDNYKKGTFLNCPIYKDSFLEEKEAHNYCYFIAIGDNEARKSIFNKMRDNGFEFINIIDKTAIISKTASIGIGCFFGKTAIVNADAHIGDNVIINTRALVEHECNVHSNVHISTNSVLNGGVIIEEGAFIGSCTVINELKHIQEWSVVGSGSVVITDVEERSLYVGVPARFKKNISNKE